METTLQVENGNTPAAIRDFLKKLLEHGIVDLLLVPMRTPSGTVTPTLVSQPGLLDAADPLAPVLPVNSATLVGKLSVRQPRSRVGAVLRSCEIRALVELVKFQQASLEDVLLISLDCAGTYSVASFMKKESSLQAYQSSAPSGVGLWQELYKGVQESPDTVNPELRAACQMCEQPVYDEAPIILGLHGSNLGAEIHLTIKDELAERLQLTPGQPNGRNLVVDKLVSARTTARDQAFTQIRSRLEGQETLSGVFAACIRCHNCMNVCPICYCKTCVFKSAVFDHEPMQFTEWAHQKGALRMPSDTMLFHLTRQNHMVLSCVGCGMCTEACPAELPVGLVFRAVGQRLQQVFEYSPGRNVEEPLPLVTFKADEWTEVGE